MREGPGREQQAAKRPAKKTGCRDEKAAANQDTKKPTRREKSVNMLAPQTLSHVLDENRQRGRPSLVVYLTGGLPDLTTTARLVETVALAGADAVELGIPFSDPIMDGPVIQAASQRALTGGTTPEQVFDVVREVSGLLPVGLMTYANIVGHMGWNRFAARAAAAGATAVIIPDLPLEEAESWLLAAQAKGIESVLFVAPTSSDERILKNAARTQGFLYAVGTLGVTGERHALADTVAALTVRAKALTTKPVLVGVGVSTPAQAAEAAATADGVVVGSAVVRRVLEAAGPDEAVETVQSFVGELRAALDEVAQPMSGPAFDAACELCEAARLTPWFHEDDLCWIAECEACSVPIVVWRHHGLPAPADEKAMLARLGRVAEGRFGEGKWFVDGERRQIPDHWHAHARWKWV